MLRSPRPTDPQKLSHGLQGRPRVSQNDLLLIVQDVFFTALHPYLVQCEGEKRSKACADHADKGRERCQEEAAPSGAEGQGPAVHAFMSVVMPYAGLERDS